jgi:uncharacterized protein (TIGR04222 family)
MNPFDLRGPDFLLFYLVLGVAAVAVLVLARKSRESGSLPALQLDDPYLLACLSRGPQEVIRVSTISLVDRGFLQVSRGMVSRRGDGPTVTSSQPEIEKQVLDHFSTRNLLKSAFAKSSAPMDSAKQYEAKLQQYNLVPNADGRRARRLWTGVIITILLVVGLGKVITAIDRGHSNVGFLIILTVIAVIVAIKVGNPYRTSLGDAYLASVRGMFTDLKGRAQSLHPGGGTKELLWLVALFGMAAVPAAVFPFIREFPVPQTSSGYSSSNSCSSSCGSSGGGSSGCGGGGCGGGCGGCGS